MYLCVSTCTLLNQFIRYEITPLYAPFACLTNASLSNLFDLLDSCLAVIISSRTFSIVFKLAFVELPDRGQFFRIASILLFMLIGLISLQFTNASSASMIRSLTSSLRVSKSAYSISLTIFLGSDYDFYYFFGLHSELLVSFRRLEKLLLKTFTVILIVALL